MTRNYSTTLLAFIVLTFILLTFPSQVRSQDTKEPVILAQVGSGVIGAVKDNPEEYAEDDFSEDMWGDSEHEEEATLLIHGKATTGLCSSSTTICISTS